APPSAPNPPVRAGGPPRPPRARQSAVEVGDDHLVVGDRLRRFLHRRARLLRLPQPGLGHVVGPVDQVAHRVHEVAVPGGLDRRRTDLDHVRTVPTTALVAWWTLLATRPRASRAHGPAPSNHCSARWRSLVVRSSSSTRSTKVQCSPTGQGSNRNPPQRTAAKERTL